MIMGDLVELINHQQLVWDHHNSYAIQVSLRIAKLMLPRHTTLLTVFLITSQDFVLFKLYKTFMLATIQAWLFTGHYLSQVSVQEHTRERGTLSACRRQCWKKTFGDAVIWKTVVDWGILRSFISILTCPISTAAAWAAMFVPRLAFLNPTVPCPKTQHWSYIDFHFKIYKKDFYS